jgi:hypothetical protein
VRRLRPQSLLSTPCCKPKANQADASGFDLGSTCYTKHTPPARLRAEHDIGGEDTAMPLSENSTVASEYTSMRVAVVQIEDHPPMVTVLSDTDGQFTLRIAGEEQAKQLASCLYKDLDVSVEIFRDANRTITGGQLLEFFIVEELSPERQLEVWREWFAEADAGWNDVDDIEEELRRLRSE